MGNSDSGLTVERNTWACCRHDSWRTAGEETILRSVLYRATQENAGLLRCCGRGEGGKWFPRIVLAELHREVLSQRSRASWELEANALGRQRPKHCCEFQAILVYVEQGVPEKSGLNREILSQNKRTNKQKGPATAGEKLSLQLIITYYYKYNNKNSYCCSSYYYWVFWDRASL